MKPALDYVEAASRRHQENRRIWDRNLALIRAGRYWETEEPEAMENFFTRRGYGANQARAVFGAGAAAAEVAGRIADQAGDHLRFERTLGLSDMMEVSFLMQGIRVSQTVGRVVIGGAQGQPAGYGTGFLVSPRLLLTNHHVLRDAQDAAGSVVEFNYQREGGQLLQPVSFGFAPQAFFHASRELDYALVAVMPRSGHGRELTAFGWNPLLASGGKVVNALYVNIIQHPNGEPKKLVLRENQIVMRLPQFLHYTADTEPGSSGSPVFNDRWEVVALHHSGVWATDANGRTLAVDGTPWTAAMGADKIKWIANEGVRVSSILADLRARSFPAEGQALLTELFAAKAPQEPGPTPPEAAWSRSGLGADGTATWTIPLTVSVKLGVGAMGGADKPSGEIPPPAAPTTPPPAAPASPVTSAGDEQAVLQAARLALSSDENVLSVRLGYEFDPQGWITKQRAIVVTLRRQPEQVDAATLPKAFGGLPVRGELPDIEQLLRFAPDTKSREAYRFYAAGAALETRYVRPNIPLPTVTGMVPLVLHASPDAGWPQLKAFLAATKRTLTVAMYDFGAPHIVEELKKALRKRSFKKLRIVIQPGESVGGGTKADDLEDAEAIEQLRQAAPGKVEVAWVSIGSRNGWVKSSYHIKVAVRDHTSFWLSSGNWQSSNQPDAEPLLDQPAQAKWLSKYNREWHVIVDHAELARAYEGHIDHDYANNQDNDPQEAAAMDWPDLFVSAAAFAPQPEEAGRVVQYFPPLATSRTTAVTALLTPDNYYDAALRLIKSARHELLIQNQTFNAPRSGATEHEAFMQAIVDRENAGVNVQIIFRNFPGPKLRGNLEALQELGINMSKVRLQAGCHTKGIIVDGQWVLVGSQNISTDGITANRDASLLIDSQEAAKYFADMFHYDWANWAKQSARHHDERYELAPPGAVPPPGLVRVTAKEYLNWL